MQADIDAIEAQNRKGVEAFNAQDAEGVAKFFTEDCKSIVPGSPPVVGRAGAAAIIGGFFKKGVKSAETTTDEIFPMGEYYLKRGVISLFNAEKKLMDKMNYMHIWRKDNGEWLHFYDMVNSQTPPKSE